jgi:hypothetical protein
MHKQRRRNRTPIAAHHAEFRFGWELLEDRAK